MKTFKLRHGLDTAPSTIRVCANHGGCKPPAGYVPCEKQPKGTDHWFPVYLPVGSVPVELRPKGSQ